MELADEESNLLKTAYLDIKLEVEVQNNKINKVFLFKTENTLKQIILTKMCDDIVDNDLLMQSEEHISIDKPEQSTVIKAVEQIFYVRVIRWRRKI